MKIPPLSPPRVYMIFFFPPTLAAVHQQHGYMCFAWTMSTPQTTTRPVLRQGVCGENLQLCDRVDVRIFLRLARGCVQLFYVLHAKKIPRKYLAWATMSAVESVLDCACQGGECPDDDEKSRTCFCSSI